MKLKKILLGCMACALSLSLLGCELVSVDEGKDNAQEVLVIGDKSYNKEMVNGFIDAQLKNYGIDKPKDKTYDEYRITMGEEYAKEKAIVYYAVQNGYKDKLSDEDKKAVDDEMAKTTKKYETDIVTAAKDALGIAQDAQLSEDDQEKLNKRVEQDRKDFLVGEGVSSLEEKKDELLNQKAAQAYVKTLEEGVNVSDEEVKNKYDSLVSEQTGSFPNDPGAYATAVEKGDVTVFVPEGFRRIKHVLIKIDEGSSTRIKALESEIAALTDGEEKTNKQSELDILKKDAYGKIEAKAKSIEEQAKKGADFDKLIAESGEDEGAKTNKDGYLLHEKITDKYDKAFQDGGMALEKVGDISAPVQSAFGYHILLYASNVESKTEDMETVSSGIQKELLENKKQKIVTDKITTVYDGYKADGTVKVYFDRLKIAAVPGK